jgi:hypothetical protein
MKDRVMYDAYNYVPDTPRTVDDEDFHTVRVLRFVCPIENLLLIPFFSDLTIEYYQLIYEM